MFLLMGGTGRNLIVPDILACNLGLQNKKFQNKSKRNKNDKSQANIWYHMNQYSTRQQVVIKISEQLVSKHDIKQAVSLDDF